MDTTKRDIVMVIILVAVLMGLFALDLFQGREQDSDGGIPHEEMLKKTPEDEVLTEFNRYAHDGDEEEILNLLNEDGKEYYFKSKEIRARYPESNPRNHFILQGYSLDEMDEEGYFHHSPGDSGFVPNPVLYDDIPQEIPRRFYRYVKDCATHVTTHRQVLYAETGYANFIGRNRYQEQCIKDGSFDNYYVESLEKLE